MLQKKIVKNIALIVIIGVALSVPYISGNRYYMYACKITGFMLFGAFYPPYKGIFTEASMPENDIRKHIDIGLTNLPSYQFDRLSDIKFMLIRQSSWYNYISSFIVSDQLKNEIMSYISPLEEIMFIKNKISNTDDIFNALFISKSQGSKKGANNNFFEITRNEVARCDWWTICQLTNVDIRCDEKYDELNRENYDTYIFLQPNTNRIWIYGKKP